LVGILFGVVILPYNTIPHAQRQEPEPGERLTSHKVEDPGPLASGPQSTQSFDQPQMDADKHRNIFPYDESAQANVFALRYGNGMRI